MDVSGGVWRMPAANRVGGDKNEGKGNVPTEKGKVEMKGALVECRDQLSWGV